jgi:asparagine synthase (glutamine-hydrolysing)
MCGIAGIIKPESDAPALETALVRMKASLLHRGPDDAGLFVSPRAGAGFVHTRLSILDLTPAGHQPMQTPDGRFTVVFNGEIYNFRALRDGLAAQGVVFRSHSDTEVLLRLYERDGPAFASSLRGMFAFAIWDECERSCFLARDPLGIKPLYYSSPSGSLVFASELRALLASGLLEKQLHPPAVFGFFQTGSVPEPGTLLREVSCLAAGSSLVWKSAHLTHRRFWSLNFPAAPEAAQPNPAPVVREALLNSVRHHFVSDVPVGVFLSGGIDSTALVALSRAVGQQDLRTFSISFDDSAFNEGNVARQTSDHFKTRHEDWRLGAPEGRQLFDTFLAHLDQPTIDGFNTFTVSKFAHDQGMKVVLSGLGGDELFGGYPSFSKVPALFRWSRNLGIVPPVRSLSAKILARSRSPQRRRLGSFLAAPPTLLSAYRAYRGIYATEEAIALARHFTGVNLKDPRAEPSLGEGEGEGRLQLTPSQSTAIGDQVSALELQLYMRNQLLRDSDVMSMAWGLELRVPLVDHVLVETVARVPAALRLRAGKKMLLDAVHEIPDWVRNQPKRGFRFPFEQWLAGEWRETFETSVKKSPVPAQTWYQKWSLFVFENWCAANRIPQPPR